MIVFIVVIITIDVMPVINIVLVIDVVPVIDVVAGYYNHYYGLCGVEKLLNYPRKNFSRYSFQIFTLQVQIHPLSTLPVVLSEFIK